MLPLFLTAVFLFGLGSSQTVNDCPASIPRNKYLQVRGNLCYEFILGVDNQLDHNTAEEDCRAHGGTLVTPTSDEVTKFLVDKLVYDYGDATPIWIGLDDKVTEGTYVWADGTPLGDYKNWAANQETPNQLHDCVYLDPSKDGKWGQDFCKNLIFELFLYERNYVCQYKTRAPTAAPATV